MNSKSIYFLVLAALLGWSSTAVGAQNVQNWLQNEAGQIQQGYGSGMINQGQAGRLQAQEAQIVSQDQRYLQQNGGQLTPQQNRQIDSELSGLKRHFMRDVSKNNPGAYNNGMYPPGTGLPNGLMGNPYGAYYPPVPQNAGWPNQFNYPNWYQQNSTAIQQLTPQQQSALYRYYRRHYQQGF